MALEDLLFDFLRLANRALVMLTSPGRLYVLIRKGPNMVEFQVTALLPAVNPDDNVTNREITATVNGTAQPATSVPVTQGQYDLWAKENDKVQFSLVDIDQAGNRSQASVSDEITVTDTIPPQTPGAVPVSITGQRTV